MLLWLGLHCANGEFCSHAHVPVFRRHRGSLCCLVVVCSNAAAAQDAAADEAEAKASSFELNAFIIAFVFLGCLCCAPALLVAALSACCPAPAVLTESKHRAYRIECPQASGSYAPLDGKAAERPKRPPRTVGTVSEYTPSAAQAAAIMAAPTREQDHVARALGAQVRAFLPVVCPNVVPLRVRSPAALFPLCASHR